jgi:hypothetical protein
LDYAKSEQALSRAFVMCIWRAARAADLKFLHDLQQTLLGTSNRKRH